MAVICEFGTAPEQAKQGYKIVGLVYGTDEELLDEYGGLDVRFVRGAAVHGQPGVYEFAAMHPLKSMQVTNAHWPTGATGCVSRNYEDGKWRIVCDPRRKALGEPGDFTYASRTEAAKAERALIAEQARALLHKARCNVSSPQLLSARLVCDKHGYQDFDIEGHPTVHRACVPNGIRVGQQFNVYHGEGMKSGAIWTGTLEGSLRKFSCC